MNDEAAPHFPDLGPPLPEVGPLALRAVGEGEPVVLLHGLSRVATSWGRVASELSRTHRVLLPDHPGMGDSRALPFPLGLRSYARLHRETLEASGEKGPFHIVGLSMGGMVALALAADLKERCASVMIQASSTLETGFWRLAPGALLRIFGRMILYRSTGHRVNLPEMVSPARLKAFPELGRELARHLRVADSRPGHLLRQLLACAGFRGGRDFLRLPERRLVVVGDADRFVPASNSIRFAKKSRSPLLVKPGLAHDFSLDDPSGTAELIARFVDDGVIELSTGSERES